MHGLDLKIIVADETAIVWYQYHKSNIWNMKSWLILPEKRAREKETREI